MDLYSFKDRLHYFLFGVPLCQPRVGSHSAILPDYIRRTKILYIHIPKAGGSSISMGLYGRQVGHRTFREWEGEFGPIVRDLTTFSVLREPLSRFVSAFWFLKGGGMNHVDAEFATTYLSKYDNPGELASNLLDPTVQGNILKYYHFKPQYEFICDTDFDLSIDYLIPLSNLQAGLETMFEAKGFRFDVPRLNEGTGSRVPNTEIQGEALDILKLIYRDDFYTYELISSQSYSSGI